MAAAEAPQCCEVDGLTGAPRERCTGVLSNRRSMGCSTDPVTTGRHHRWRVMTVVTASSEATALDVEADDADDTAATRHARALAALRSAEVRTGVRKQATAARTIQAIRPEPFAAGPADRPADRPAGRPANWSADRQADHLADRPADRSVGRSVDPADG